MRHRRLAALAFVPFLAGCGPSPATPAASPKGATSLAATPAAASSSANATAAPSAAGLAVGPFEVQLPVGWHARPVLPNPSGNWTIDYLGPGDLPSECTTLAGGGGACGPWPKARLGPGGIVVAVRQHGMPGSRPPAGGEPGTVAGLPARLAKAPADAGCAALGGSLSTSAVISSVPGQNGWFSIDACIAGPDTAAAQATFASILSSARVTGS